MWKKPNKCNSKGTLNDDYGLVFSYLVVFLNQRHNVLVVPKVECALGHLQDEGSSGYFTYSLRNFSIDIIASVEFNKSYPTHGMVKNKIESFSLRFPIFLRFHD